MIVCPRCATPLPTGEFVYRRRGGYSKRSDICRLCETEAAMRKLEVEREKILLARRRREAAHRASDERAEILEQCKRRAAGERE